MAQRPQCREDGTVVHKGFAPTGRTAPPDRPGGKHWEIWVCQCGGKEHYVLPGTKKDW